jgi:hypothetical protein
MLAELCLFIAGMSILYILCVPVRLYREDPADLFPAAYLQKQSAAMAAAVPSVLEEEGIPEISFNEKGNVAKAMTLHIGRKNTAVIVELGGGRLVFR